MHKLKDLQEANRTIGYSIEEGEDAMKLDELIPPFEKTEACYRSSNESSKIPLEKVLIFSQFLEHIHVIEKQVTLKLQCMNLLI